MSTGIISLLIKKNFIDSSNLDEYKDKAKEKKLSILDYLISESVVDGDKFAILSSDKFGIPYLNIDSYNLDFYPKDIVSIDLINQYNILPLHQRDKTIYIAISDPTDLNSIDQVKFQTHFKCETIIVNSFKLNNVINSLFNQDKVLDALNDSDDDSFMFEEEEEVESEDFSQEIDEKPIVKYVNKILYDAIRKGASDIHIEPYEKVFRVRFRIDGILTEVSNPPTSISARLISIIKVMSKMDIAEKRLPQDGRIQFKVSKTQKIDFRVNTCPTLFGEKIVLRILDPTNAEMGIEKLGFEKDQQEDFLDAINKPYGMVLVTGPTGSGKTVSLYTGLNILNEPTRNISTAEDPVEITVSGINQVNMNNKAGLTFSVALRAFLRQDPDIIMVGEIRDQETAEIAVKAAQTGHLVLSTLHTNDAPQTLNRLTQMGIPAFNIAASVNLIMAQRLARRLCSHCKVKSEMPESDLLAFGFKESDLNDLVVYEANKEGCEKCSSGYKGRVGIYQVMKISEDMRAVILEGGGTLEIEAQANKEGINDLKRSGVIKIISGVTTIEEIDRVISGH